MANVSTKGSGSIISICLPVYNGERYLSQAIESLLAQTHPDFELLIADDCSIDATPAIVEKYAKQDRRIKYWQNSQNLGLFANYNACLEKASGRYIKLFAQDDLLHAAALERMVAVLDAHPDVQLVSGARQWINEAGALIAADSESAAKAQQPFGVDTMLSTGDAVTGTLLEASNWLGEPSALMFRREAADGGFDTSFRQVGDLEYAYRLLRSGNYYFIADVLCSFRSHADNASAAKTFDLTAYLDWFLLGAKYESYLNAAGFSREEFCLRVIRLVTQNCEGRINNAIRQGTNERCQVLKQFLASTDFSNPLAFFQYAKNAPRKHDAELQAIGIVAFVQAALVENEMRLLHEQLAFDPNFSSNEELLQEVRPAFAKGIASVKQLLERRLKRIEALKKSVRKVYIEKQSVENAKQGLEDALAEKNEEIALLRRSLDEVGNSLSWKVTEPLRLFKRLR